MLQLATKQVIGRPQGATLILPCIMKGATILALLLKQGFFNEKESKGDLTRDHYLISPPIEALLKEFSHPKKFRDGRVGTRTRVTGLRGKLSAH